jgi:hypothetical protein
LQSGNVGRRVVDEFKRGGVGTGANGEGPEEVAESVVESVGSGVECKG